MTRTTEYFPAVADAEEGTIAQKVFTFGHWRTAYQQSHTAEIAHVLYRVGYPVEECLMRAEATCQPELPDSETVDLGSLFDESDMVDHVGPTRKCK